MRQQNGHRAQRYSRTCEMSSSKSNTPLRTLIQLSREWSPAIYDPEVEKNTRIEGRHLLLSTVRQSRISTPLQQLLQPVKQRTTARPRNLEICHTQNCWASRRTFAQSMFCFRRPRAHGASLPVWDECLSTLKARHCLQYRTICGLNASRSRHPAIAESRGSAYLRFTKCLYYGQYQITLLSKPKHAPNPPPNMINMGGKNDGVAIRLISSSVTV